MGEHTAIAWCDATFNPWWGCERISPACDHCYAASWAHRLGRDALWDGERRFFGVKHWKEPLRWDRQAHAAGIRRRVFCASMADVFDNHGALTVERIRLWNLIHATPHLDWLLLTKRIGNAARMAPTWWRTAWPENVWVGATTVTQQEVERDVPKLLEVPARIRFLSCEPLLEPLDLWRWLRDGRLHWVIVGGESGAHARPMYADWVHAIRADCHATDTPFFMKQGSQANWTDFKLFERFPEEVRVREWPR